MCSMHRPSSCSPLLRIRQTLFSLDTASFLCPFQIGATFLHRYCTWLWSPELPHMHIEHEQCAPSTFCSISICVSVFEVRILVMSEWCRNSGTSWSTEIGLHEWHPAQDVIDGQHNKPLLVWLVKHAGPSLCLQDCLSLWALKVIQTANQGQIHIKSTLVRILECTAKKEFYSPKPQLTPMSFVSHVEPSKGDVCVFLRWDYGHILHGVALPSFIRRKGVATNSLDSQTQVALELQCTPGSNVWSTLVLNQIIQQDPVEFFNRRSAAGIHRLSQTKWLREIGKSKPWQLKRQWLQRWELLNRHCWQVPYLKRSSAIFRACTLKKNQKTYPCIQLYIHVKIHVAKIFQRYVSIYLSLYPWGKHVAKIFQKTRNPCHCVCRAKCQRKYKPLFWSSGAVKVKLWGGYILVTQCETLRW